jgi:Fic family protein
MRKYEGTHPWIKFQVDLKHAPVSLWLNLGEAQSKCEHISNEPLRPSLAKELHQLYVAKGVLATTAIEGNTLTEGEVRQQLEGNLKLPPSKEYMRQEVENVATACNKIKEGLMKGSGSSIGVATIKEFNQLILEKLPHESHTIPGQFRQCSVVVGPYRGAPPEDCEYLVARLCEWLASSDFAGNESQRIVYAILKSVIAHLYLAWIHPFGDGNGRTARLVEFQILLAAGVPTPAAHLLSNHYNQTRQEYYRQLDLASKSGGDVLPFICYAVQGFVDGLREQLHFIKLQQFDIVWRNFIYEKFRDQNSVAAQRQLRLALDLGDQQNPVELSKITELTPKLAKFYAKKTMRTIQRDVLELESKDLIKRSEAGIRANRELILGFLPVKISSNDSQQMKLL